MKDFIRAMRVSLAAVILGKDSKSLAELNYYCRWVNDGKPDLMEWVLKNVPARESDDQAGLI